MSGKESGGAQAKYLCFNTTNVMLDVKKYVFQAIIVKINMAGNVSWHVSSSF